MSFNNEYVPSGIFNNIMKQHNEKNQMMYDSVLDECINTLKKEIKNDFSNRCCKYYGHMSSDMIEFFNGHNINVTYDTYEDSYIGIMKEGPVYLIDFKYYHDIDTIISQVHKEIEKQINDEFNMVVKDYKKSYTKYTFTYYGSLREETLERLTMEGLEYKYIEGNYREPGYYYFSFK